MPLFLTVRAASRHRREPMTSNTGRTCSIRFIGYERDSVFFKSQGESRRVEFLSTEESQAASACVQCMSGSNREEMIESVS